MNAQIEFLLTTEAPTQNEIILDHLQCRAGQWVPMPELGRIAESAAVHSRINDLRQKGHFIDNRKERKGRKVTSFYRLNSSESSTTETK